MTTYDEMLASALCGIEHRKEDPSRVFAEIERRFPVQHSKVDWQRVPGAVSRPDGHLPGAPVRFFREAIATSGLDALAYVGDGLTSTSVVAAPADFIAVIEPMLDIPQHHYFFDMQRGFCISFTMEGDMHYGFPPPGGAGRS